MEHTKIDLVPEARKDFEFSETGSICKDYEPFTLTLLWQDFEVYYKQHVADLKKTPRERLAEEIAKTTGQGTSIGVGEKDYAHLLMMKEKK